MVRKRKSAVKQIELPLIMLRLYRQRTRWHIYIGTKRVKQTFSNVQWARRAAKKFARKVKSIIREDGDTKTIAELLFSTLFPHYEDYPVPPKKKRRKKKRPGPKRKPRKMSRRMSSGEWKKTIYSQKRQRQHQGDVASVDPSDHTPETPSSNPCDQA